MSVCLQTKWLWVWLSVCLQTKWLWVWAQLKSLKLQISRLFEQGVKNVFVNFKINWNTLMKILYLKGYKWLLSPQKKRVRIDFFGSIRYQALARHIKPFKKKELKWKDVSAQTILQPIPNLFPDYSQLKCFLKIYTPYLKSLQNMWNNDNPFDFSPWLTQWLREEEESFKSK